MAQKKPFVLRLDPELLKAMEKWASDEFRSTNGQLEWIIMKALLMVSEEGGKIVKMDCKDFRILLDVVGVDWETKDILPSLLDEQVKFNLDLRPGLDDENAEPTEGTGGDEIEPD